MANEKRLIDANKEQAVLVNMAEHLMEAGNPEMAGAVGYAAEVIGKQRTVDAVEVVHAEWLDGYGVCENKKSYTSIDCSNCGEYFKIPGDEGDAEEWKKRFAFCPFCGAKMDGGNEDG